MSIVSMATELIEYMLPSSHHKPTLYERSTAKAKDYFEVHSLSDWDEIKMVAPPYKLAYLLALGRVKELRPLYEMAREGTPAECIAMLGESQDLIIELAKEIQEATEAYLEWIEKETAELDKKREDISDLGYEATKARTGITIYKQIERLSKVWKQYEQAPPELGTLQVNNVMMDLHQMTCRRRLRMCAHKDIVRKHEESTVPLRDLVREITLDEDKKGYDWTPIPEFWTLFSDAKMKQAMIKPSKKDAGTDVE